PSAKSSRVPTNAWAVKIPKRNLESARVASKLMESIVLTSGGGTMRHFIRQGSVTVAAAALVLDVPAKAAEVINGLTGVTSGGYYPVGVALSQIYGKALPDAKVQVQATQASAENLALLESGKGEVAFTLGDALSD